jgi:hypothetical protein
VKHSDIVTFLSNAIAMVENPKRSGMHTKKSIIALLIKTLLSTSLGKVEQIEKLLLKCTDEEPSRSIRPVQSFQTGITFPDWADYIRCYQICQHTILTGGN